MEQNASEEKREKEEEEEEKEEKEGRRGAEVVFISGESVALYLHTCSAKMQYKGQF